VIDFSDEGKVGFGDAPFQIGSENRVWGKVDCQIVSLCILLFWTGRLGDGYLPKGDGQPRHVQIGKMSIWSSGRRVLFY
jgi:hypothetical protein